MPPPILQAMEANTVVLGSHWWFRCVDGHFCEYPTSSHKVKLEFFMGLLSLLVAFLFTYMVQVNEFLTRELNKCGLEGTKKGASAIAMWTYLGLFGNLNLGFTEWAWNTYKSWKVHEQAHVLAINTKINIDLICYICHKIQSNLFPFNKIHKHDIGQRIIWIYH